LIDKVPAPYSVSSVTSVVNLVAADSGRVIDRFQGSPDWRGSVGVRSLPQVAHASWTTTPSPRSLP